MLKELDLPRTELFPLVRDLAKVFVMRTDVYPRQMDDGSYVCIRKPLKEWHLVSHLEGRITLGAYVLNRDSQARFVVFDADDKPEYARLVGMTKRLAKEGVPSYLEASRRGWHLWLFFTSHSWKPGQGLWNGLRNCLRPGRHRAVPQTTK
jgi:hypothetical protein